MPRADRVFKLRCNGLVWWLVLLVSIALVGWVVWGTVSSLASIYTMLPLYDSWSVVADLRTFDWSFGNGFRYLLDEYNEHRIFLTRLVMMMDYTLLGGRKLLPVVLIHALNLCSIAMAWRICRDRGEGRIPYLVRLVWVSLPFLSVMQVKNFDSVFQIQFFWVSVFSMGAIIAMAKWVSLGSSGTPDNRWIAVALIMAFLASFSMANGLLVWVVLIGLLLSNRGGLRWILLTVGTGAICAVMYFDEFGSLGKQHEVPISFDLLPRGILYMCCFVANLLCDKDSVSLGFMIVGALGWLMASWLVVSGTVLRGRTDGGTAAAWMLVFIAGTVWMAFLGRLRDGDPFQGINGRYTTVSAWFWALTLGCWMAPWNPAWKVASRWVGFVFRYAPTLLVLVLLLMRQVDLMDDLRQISDMRKRSDVVVLSGTADRNWLNSISAGLRWPNVELMRKMEISYFGTEAFAALGSRLDLSAYPENLEFRMTPERVVLLPFIEESWSGIRMEGKGSGLVCGRRYRLVNGEGVLLGYVIGHSCVDSTDAGASVHIDAACRGGLGYVLRRETLWVLRDRDRIRFDLGGSGIAMDGWVIGMVAPGRFRLWKDYRLETEWGEGCDPVSGARGFGGKVWSSWSGKSEEWSMDGHLVVNLDFQTGERPEGYVGLPFYIKGDSGGMTVSVEGVGVPGLFEIDLNGLGSDRWHFLVVNYPSIPTRLRVIVEDVSNESDRWIAVHEPMILPFECVR